MPFVVSLLAGFVTNTVVKALLTRALVALGISALTYTGVSVFGSVVVSHLNSNLSAMPAAMLTLVTMIGIPKALNVVLSAYAGALALKGLTAAGSITKYGVSSAPGAGTVFSPGTF